MESESKFKQWFQSAVDFFNEQAWFQEAKTKWEELDPQSKMYLRLAGFGLTVLAVLSILTSVMWSVHSLKASLIEKRALLAMVQNATDEMRRLRESTPSSASGSSASNAENSGGWNGYFETTAGSAGIDKASLNISADKSGASSDQSKEHLFELGLKHVNIKQITRFAFMLESGHRPVKLKNLTIDTKSDRSGHLDATLAVSAFTLVTPK